MNIASKLAAAVVGLLVLVGGTVAVIGQQVASSQIEKSVGIELIGCANITTGLIDRNDFIKLLNGDRSVQQQVNTQIDSAMGRQVTVQGSVDCFDRWRITCCR